MDLIEGTLLMKFLPLWYESVTCGDLGRKVGNQFHEDLVPGLAVHATSSIYQSPDNSVVVRGMIRFNGHLGKGAGKIMIVSDIPYHEKILNDLIMGEAVQYDNHDKNRNETISRYETLFQGYKKFQESLIGAIPMNIHGEIVSPERQRDLLQRL